MSLLPDGRTDWSDPSSYPKHPGRVVFTEADLAYHRECRLLWDLARRREEELRRWRQLPYWWRSTEWRWWRWVAYCTDYRYLEIRNSVSGLAALNRRKVGVP